MHTKGKNRKMKINSINYNNKDNNKPSFKRYYDAVLMKEFEGWIKQYKKVNPYLKGEDIAVMRKSIDSFNAVYKGVQTTSVQNIENQIYNKFHIPADFKGDKFIAAMSALTLNIFQKLRLPLPTGLYVKPLENHVSGCCDTMRRFVTFNQNQDWSDIQRLTAREKFLNWSSTGHFLKTPIHEFMHSVHLSNLHKLAAQKQQKINAIQSKLLRDFLNMDFKTNMINQAGSPLIDKTANSQVLTKVSRYGSSTPAEMYADIGAKMISYILDRKTLLPTKNPFVFKDFTEDKYLMKMMNDVWAGNITGYIK